MPAGLSGDNVALPVRLAGPVVRLEPEDNHLVGHAAVYTETQVAVAPARDRVVRPAALAQIIGGGVPTLILQEDRTVLRRGVGAEDPVAVGRAGHMVQPVG